MYHKSKNTKTQLTLFELPAIYNTSNSTPPMTGYQGLLLNTTLAEKLRLILSTFQDGFGMLDLEGTDNTLPGWRDFERATAVVFNGKSSESKDLFDVRVPLALMPGYYYGISCKMRNTLDATLKNGAVTTELSNSNKQFWAHIKQAGMTEADFRLYPAQVGKAILSCVHGWHNAQSHLNGGKVVINKSFFLTLSYNKRQQYQLHQFSHELPQASQVDWSFPPSTRSKDGFSKRIVGYVGSHVLFEWYYEAGGQLKYYPLVADCLWKSDVFQLEPLPFITNVKGALTNKAKSYFSEKWTTLHDADQIDRTDFVP